MDGGNEIYTPSKDERNCPPAARHRVDSVSALCCFLRYVRSCREKPSEASCYFWAVLFPVVPGRPTNPAQLLVLMFLGRLTICWRPPFPRKKKKKGHTHAQELKCDYGEVDHHHLPEAHPSTSPLIPKLQDFSGPTSFSHSDPGIRMYHPLINYLLKWKCWVMPIYQ